MNKNLYRLKKSFKIFGIKVGECDEQYESVYMENAEPITPFIVTEFEMNNLHHKEE